MTKDQTPIWRPGFFVVATVVNAGTELDVVAQRGDWYEVALPALGPGSTGMVHVSRVAPTSGARPTEQSPPTSPSQSAPPQTVMGSRSEPARGTVREGALRAYGQVGYGRFDAHQSFDAIFGDAGGFWFGGGVNYRHSSGVFLQGSVDLFRRTGQRVFVEGGEVFQLGIPDTVTMIPLAATVGYRFRGHRIVPYLGGGAGRYLYKETSQFADPSENVSQQFTSYHALGGVEWRGTGLIGSALEVQFTHVSNGLSGGVGDAFNEHDLGGIQMHIKLLIGR